GTMDEMKAGIQCRGMDIRKESRIASGAIDERRRKTPPLRRHNGRNESRHSMPGNGHTKGKPDDIRRNGRKKKGNALAELARTGHRGEGCPDAIRTQLPRR
ncbi:MAG: hypothetical protein ACI4AI_02530, partial [Paludibacteraceae bacterium]